MRKDGVGLRDVGAVHDGTWVPRHHCCCSDCRGAWLEHDGRVLDGRVEFELGIEEQRCKDGVDVGDGAWVRARILDGDRSGGSDGMRGDGVGVGDVGTVPGGTWIPGDASFDIDVMQSRGQHVGGVLG